MPKSTTFSNDILALVFNATAIAGLAEDDSSSPLTSLYVSLHSASPGTGGAQNTNEVAYTNYARIAVARSPAGWTVSLAQAINTALNQFAQCGVTGATATHVGIGTDSSGAGKMLYAGALNSPLTIANLIQPQFNAGALTVSET